MIWLNLQHESTWTDQNKTQLNKTVYIFDEMYAPVNRVIIGLGYGMLLKFVHKVPIYTKAAMVQIIVWRLTGDKPLSEPMMAYVTDAYMCHSPSVS